MKKDKVSQLNRVILSAATSTSGKYQILLCEHIVAGKFCYDVVAFSNIGKWSKSVHFRQESEDSVNKANAMMMFDEFRDAMTEPAKPEETDEREAFRIIEPS